MTENLGKKTISKSDFLTARRIRSNATVAIYKPDLIILDEFQRYRRVINDPTNGGYSVKYMLDYLHKTKIAFMRGYFALELAAKLCYNSNIQVNRW